MHSILGRESFCRNDCFNAAWHGGDQPVALLRCYGGPGCFDGGLKLIQSVGSCISQLSLHNIPQIPYGVQVRRVGRPNEHSNTMVRKPFTSGFGTVSTCSPFPAHACARWLWVSLLQTQSTASAGRNYAPFQNNGIKSIF